jgi:hypothetical protein
VCRCWDRGNPSGLEPREPGLKNAQPLQAAEASKHPSEARDRAEGEDGGAFLMMTGFQRLPQRPPGAWGLVLAFVLRLNLFLEIARQTAAAENLQSSPLRLLLAL